MISISEARNAVVNSLCESNSPQYASLRKVKERIELLEARYAEVFTFLDEKIHEAIAHDSFSVVIPNDHITTRFTVGEKSEDVQYGTHHQICDAVHEVLHFHKWNVTRNHVSFTINWS